MLSFQKIWKFIFKDLLSQKKLNSFLVFNLVLGFLGFLLLQVFQYSLDRQTKEKAQEILGGDLVISARRIITDDEVKKIEEKINIKFIQKTKSYDFFAMVQFEKQARLVLIKAVADPFPIYGEFKVKSLDSTESVIQSVRSQSLYVDAELIDQLQIPKGQAAQIKVGQLSLPLTGTIGSDPARTFRLGALAPFILISEKDLAATELIRPGSTVTTNIHYKLTDPKSATEFKKLLEKNFLDSTLQFSSALSEQDTGNRIFKYLIDYLGLVALIALGLCFLSLSYMLNWFFQVQKRTIAIYKVLGVEPTSILKIQVYKNLFLSLVSYFLALALAFFLSSGLQVILDQYLKINLNLVMNFSALGLGFLIVILGPQLIAIPTYLAAMNMNPLSLLRYELGTVKYTSTKVQILWGISLFIIFWILSIWQSHSLQTGSLFIAGLLAAFIISYLILFFVKKILEKVLVHFSFENQYALKSLIRKSASTNLIFMTMTLAIIVLTLLPNIKKSIIAEIRPPDSGTLPSVFMFDIQPDQKQALIDLIQINYKINLEMTPLVRSRILKINDKGYERDSNESLFKTREDENEARFRNRGVNLTYKKDLQKSETIVRGQWFSDKNNENSEQNSEQIAEISLEEKYAERVGAKISDVMTFDVQGLEIKGRVTSIRRVRWTSFQPNFFITFQPGFLDEAPQIFLTSIKGLTKDEVSALQALVVQKFPNVSIINIRQSIEQSLVFIDQMALALQIMASLSILVGFFIFIILLNTQVRERVSEMNLLQVLGSDQKQISRFMLKQFGYLILLSLFTGLFLGNLLSIVLVENIFDLTVNIDFNSMIILTSTLLLFAFIILKISLAPLRHIQPLQLLRLDGGLLND